MSSLRIPADEFIRLPLHARNVDETDEGVFDDDEDLDEDELEEDDDQDEDGPVDEADEFVIDDEEEDDDAEDEDDEDLDTEEAIDEDDELDQQRDEMRIRRQRIEDEQQSAGYQQDAEARTHREEEGSPLCGNLLTF